MRTIFQVSFLGLLGTALVHCSADGGRALTDFDAGAPLDNEAPGDAPTEDAGKGRDVATVGPCSADHWCRTPLPDQGLWLTAVWSFAAGDAVASTTTKLLQWNGTEWTAVDSPHPNGPTSLWASSPTDVWAVTEGSQHLVHGRRAARGEPFAWSKIDYDEATSPPLDIIRGVGTRDLWVYGSVSFGEEFLQHGIITTESNDGGESTTTVRSWTRIPITLAGASILSNAFWVTANHEVWLAGNGVARGVPSIEDPNRYTWTEALTVPTVGGAYRFTAIWGDDSGNLWTVSDMGESFRGTIVGDRIEWMDARTHTRGPMSSIWGSSRDDVWLVGGAGAVRHWDGTTWSVSKLSVGGLPMWEDLNSVQRGPGGDVWVVGNGVALHRAPGQGGSP